MKLAQRLAHYGKLIRVDKPIGTLLLLWPTLWALWIASEGHPHTKILLTFVLGTFLMRSAGCAVNDFADQEFDRHVERTKDRPLAAGHITSAEALSVAAILALLAFLLVLQLNALSVALSLPALLIAASYPFAKRFFVLPQAYLGIAFGFGIPMAFAAHTGALPPVAWILLLANVFWAIAYDTEYAMVDRNEDIKLGIYTSAILFGRHDVLAVMLCYATTLAVLLVVGMQLKFDWPYYAGLGVAACMMVYHYALVRTRERAHCFRAFRHNNWVGGTIFAGIVAHYLSQS